MNLRRIRLARGLSQERFAEEIGSTRNYVGGLERGERNIRLSTLENLAAGVGVDPAELLLGAESHVPS